MDNVVQACCENWWRKFVERRKIEAVQRPGKQHPLDFSAANEIGPGRRAARNDDPVGGQQLLIGMLDGVKDALAEKVARKGFGDEHISSLGEPTSRGEIDRVVRNDDDAILKAIERD